jgi:hypothetical protein
MHMIDGRMWERELVVSMSVRTPPRRGTVSLTDVLALGHALRTVTVISTPQQDGGDAKSSSSDDEEEELPLQLFAPSTDPKDIAEAEERARRYARFVEQWTELTRLREDERRRAAEAAEAERRQRRRAAAAAAKARLDALWEQAVAMEREDLALDAMASVLEKGAARRRPRG